MRPSAGALPRSFRAPPLWLPTALQKSRKAKCARLFLSPLVPPADSAIHTHWPATVGRCGRRQDCWMEALSTAVYGPLTGSVPPIRHSPAADRNPATSAPAAHTVNHQADVLRRDRRNETTRSPPASVSLPSFRLLFLAARRRGLARHLVSRFHAAIRGAIPIGYVESASTFPADNELLVKSFKWPAIKAVRLNRSSDSEFTK